MKSFIPSIIALAGLCFLAEPNSPKNLDSSPLAAVNPLCDCAPCKCVDCDCPASREESPAVVVVADEKPSITPAEAQQVAVVTEPKFTQPAPQPAPKPVAKPKAVPPKQPLPVARAVQYGSCGPGGCGVRRGIFGRRR